MCLVGIAMACLLNGRLRKSTEKKVLIKMLYRQFNFAANVESLQNIGSMCSGMNLSV